jgi:hypothetical protein
MRSARAWVTTRIRARIRAVELVSDIILGENVGRIFGFQFRLTIRTQNGVAAAFAVFGIVVENDKEARDRCTS